MKSTFLILFAFSLTTAILVPSVITFITMNEKTDIAIDFNDEEQKEDKKEVTEKDFILIIASYSISQQPRKKSKISNAHLLMDYSTALSIFILPPEYNS